MESDSDNIFYLYHTMTETKAVVALKKILKRTDDMDFYKDEELENDFCFSSPDDAAALDISFIRADAREGLGEEVKWMKYCDLFWAEDEDRRLKNEIENSSEAEYSPQSKEEVIHFLKT